MPLAVHKGAVFGAEVFQKEAVALLREAAVMRGDGGFRAPPGRSPFRARSAKQPSV